MKQLILGIIIGSVLTGAGTFAFDYQRDNYGVKPLDNQLQFELLQQQQDRMQRQAPGTEYRRSPC